LLSIKPIRFSKACLSFDSTAVYLSEFLEISMC